MPPTTTGRAARWLLAIGLFAVSVVTPVPAWAYWSSDGAGVAVALTATVDPPDVTVHSPALSDRVRVEWTEPVPPEGMHILGYVVSRSDGHAAVDACHSSTASPLPSSTLDCVDAELPDGDYTYTVTADLGPWTSSAESTPVTVAADRTGPTISLGGTAATNALIDRRSGADLLFFRPNASGGGAISITAEVTDAGVGPASATFPAVTDTRWSHAAETVTTGSGSGSTLTYVSSPVSFLQGAVVPAAIVVSAADERGNASSATLTAVADSAAPTGGALRVNGVNANAAGTTSNATGDFVINVLTPYSEAPSATASGLDASTLVRESAPISNGTCGTFGGATTIDGAAPITESGLATGCYRYALTGTDNVGNTVAVQTIVELDTSAPDTGELTVNSTAAVPGGVTTPAAATTWPLVRTDFADADSGMVTSVLTRASATLTGGTCGTYGAALTLTGEPAQTGLGTSCYRYRLVGTNAVGLTSTLEATVLADAVPPTGGAFSVNGTAATGAATPPTTNSTSSTVTIAGVVNYTDANIGLASSTLTRAVAPMSAGVCGTYGDEIAVSGSGTFTVAGLEDACHRFTLRGTDLAGNTVAVRRLVRVDTSAPVGGLLTVNGVDGAVVETTSLAAATNYLATWTLFTDPESGVTANSTVRRTTAPYSAGNCGTYGATATTVFSGTTPSGTSTQGTTTACYRYVLTTTNAFGVASTLTTVVRLDTSPPSAGTMTANGSAGNGTGLPNSGNGTGAYSVTVTTLGADIHSGATVTLERTETTIVSPGLCDTTYVNPVPMAFTVNTAISESGLEAGCYRYTVTTTNGVGGVARVMATVRVVLTLPVGGALNVNGVDATNAGSTSQATVNSFTIARTDWTDPETVITSTLVRTTATLLGGVCGTAWGSPLTIAVTTQTSTPTTNCYKYVLTGTNPLVGPPQTLTTIVMLDTSAPASGAFRVAGVNASAAANVPQSNQASGANFSVSSFTNYTEPSSVLVSSTFTRTTGVSTAGVCGNFDASTTVTLPNSTQTQNGLPNGCYRYTLTGVNSFGLTASISAQVRVGP